MDGQFWGGLGRRWGSERVASGDPGKLRVRGPRRLRAGH